MSGRGTDSRALAGDDGCRRRGQLALSSWIAVRRSWAPSLPTITETWRRTVTSEIRNRSAILAGPRRRRRGADIGQDLHSARVQYAADTDARADVVIGDDHCDISVRSVQNLGVLRIVPIHGYEIHIEVRIPRESRPQTTEVCD